MSNKKPEVKELLDSGASGQSIAVNAASTVYTEKITLDKQVGFGIFYQASSGGTIALDVTVQASPDNTNFCDVDAFPLVHNDLADSNLHAKILPLPMFPYVRLKIVGGATNAATTKIRFWLSY